LEVVRRTLSSLLDALLCCWQEDFSGARAGLEVARGWLRSCDANIWVNAFVSWVAAELAWDQQDWSTAEAALMEMTELAGNTEHEQLASLSHRLKCQVFEQQGKHESAPAHTFQPPCCVVT
jgi:hypothetical protein